MVLNQKDGKCDKNVIKLNRLRRCFKGDMINVEL